MLGVESGQALDRKERKKLLVSQLRELTSQIVTDESKIKEFAERWRSGFHNYSLSNLFLIWFQCPGYSLVAGYNQWRKVGRYVKKGSKAIWILAPMIVRTNSKHVLERICSDKKEKEEEIEETEEDRVITGFIPVHVFDYSQTDGDELDIGNTLIKGNGNLEVEAVSQAFDVPVKNGQGVADGWTDGKVICINRRKNKTQEVACYLHEMAHVLLGHAEETDKRTPKDIRELQAESVSYIVCKCIGIENEGAGMYLGSYNGDKDRLKEHSHKIVSVADKILRKVYPLLEKVEVSQSMRGQAVLF